MTITITITIACIDTEGATPLPDYHTPAITIIMWFVGDGMPSIASLITIITGL